MFETEFESRYGGAFRMYVYTNKVAYAEHIALVKGDITSDEPVLVRMHALNILEDILGDASSDKSGQLHAAMQMIGDIEHPTMEFGCMDGVNTFILLGGEFKHDFDVYSEVKWDKDSHTRSTLNDDYFDSV